MTAVALDTSVAVPLLVQTHAAHLATIQWWDGRPAALSGHALLETYSVLTRLPGDLRLDPSDAALLLTRRFERPLALGARTAARLPVLLAGLGIAGGAAYDAAVAFAAVEHDLPLATRDARALSTYERVGADVVVV